MVLIKIKPEKRIIPSCMCQSRGELTVPVTNVVLLAWLVLIFSIRVVKQYGNYAFCVNGEQEWRVRTIKYADYKAQILCNCLTLRIVCCCSMCFPNRLLPPVSCPASTALHHTTALQPHSLRQHRHTQRGDGTAHKLNPKPAPFKLYIIESVTDV